MQETDSPSAEVDLDTLARGSAPWHRLDRDTIEYSYAIFSRHLVPGSILELGPADGYMTSLLRSCTSDLTCVEGASIFSERLKVLYPDIEVVNSRFEEFAPSRRYDNIIVGHVLEHVNDPQLVLRKARDWLSPRGKIMGAVPNANSLHRQVAVRAGLIEHEAQLGEADRAHGHKRVYRMDELRRDFEAAGWRVERTGGYWLKPFSNKQLYAVCDARLIRAFMEIGEAWPEIAAECYIVASHLD